MSTEETTEAQRHALSGMVDKLSPLHVSLVYLIVQLLLVGKIPIKIVLG